MVTGDRFWISTNRGDTWKEVDLDEWISWEQACGFHARGFGHVAATAGFGSGCIQGHMHYGWFNMSECETGPHKR